MAFSQLYCYNPQAQQCLNRTLCSNDRICNEQCITGYNPNFQVCANDQHTICNVTKMYYYYQPNQIQLCLGVCYDSFLQQCSGDHVVLCIHDPITQLCVPQSINSSTTTNLGLITTNNITSFSNLTGSSTISISTSSTTSSAVLTNSTLTFTSSTSSSILPSSTTSSLLSSHASILTTLTNPLSQSTFSTTTTATTTFTSTSTSPTPFSTSFTSSTTITNMPTRSTDTTSSMISSSSTLLSILVTSSSTSSNPTSHSSSSTTSSTISTPRTTTVTLPSLDNCCTVQQCTMDADCCVTGVECQCYHHNQSYVYGSCLNPHVKPVCADGCPKQGMCLSDVDCCKCQCGTITVTNVSGTIITRKQVIKEM